jgi:hypothetical protein
MNCKTMMASLALAGTLAGGLTAPLAAQPYNGYNNNGYNNAAAGDFWRGAPDGLQQRIDWLQQRIDRGVSDGTLSRAEANRNQYQLDMLKRDASALSARLNNLSRNIRWARNNGNGYYGGAYGGASGANYGNYRAPYSTDYDASRYYRDGPNYTERRLAPEDEVYRGSDGRYYCKRSDGTTGLVIGAVGGAAIGSAIDSQPRGVTGLLIGGALGALVGKKVDQSSNDVRCR